MTWFWMDAWTNTETGKIHSVRLADDHGETVAETRAYLAADIVVSHPNAHLIAAAPELLAAVKGLHAAEQNEYGEILPCGKGAPCPTCDLIAKAESK